MQNNDREEVQILVSWQINLFAALRCIENPDCWRGADYNSTCYPCRALWAVIKKKKRVMAVEAILTLSRSSILSGQAGAVGDTVDSAIQGR